MCPFTLLPQLCKPYFVILADVPWTKANHLTKSRVDARGTIQGGEHPEV